jgi:hypothetical protein
VAVECRLWGPPVRLQSVRGPTECTERIKTADLVELAGDAAITTRTLEFWRHEGLLPAAKRTGQDGKRPEWTYPAEAAEQLAALLRLRAKTRRPDVLRVALWFEGFPVEPRRVRTSVAAVLRDGFQWLTREVEKHRDRTAAAEGSTWEALEQIGRKLAGKHGPRYARQKREDRARAMTLVLGLVLGDEDAFVHLDDDAEQVERMLGLHRARRPIGGLPAWLHGPASDGLAEAARLGSLPALIETVGTLTDEELEASRVLARIMLDGMTAFTRIADAFAITTDNAVGLAAIEEFRDEPMTAVWITAFVIAVRRSGTLSKNLGAVIDDFSRKVLPIDKHARELAALSDDDLHKQLPNLGGLPFIEQARLKRLIAEYREGA